MYEEAYNLVVANEGGYVYDECDSGGETYMGISRVYHPNWRGWEILDNYKHILPTQKSSLKEIVENSEELKKIAKEYYKKEFWDKFVTPLGLEDARVCIYIFDMCVNIGSWSKILQRGINKCGANLEVDGLIGDKTIEALNGVDTSELLRALIEYRVKHYARLVQSRPKLKKFLGGWVNRSFNI
jgi:lysozyme family protein